MSDQPRFQEPGWFTKHVFNRLVAVATRLGLSVAGSRVLEVKGRKSGEWRRTPVNLLELEGARYLVAPRGDTQWVRNMRVSGVGRLILGPRVEEFTAKEVPKDDRVPLLRAYLEKWKWEVGLLRRRRPRLIRRRAPPNRPRPPGVPHRLTSGQFDALSRRIDHSLNEPAIEHLWGAES